MFLIKILPLLAADSDIVLVWPLNVEFLECHSEVPTKKNVFQQYIIWVRLSEIALRFEIFNENNENK